MKKIVVILLMLCLLTGCGAGEKPESSDPTYSDVVSETTLETVSEPNEETADRWGLTMELLFTGAEQFELLFSRAEDAAGELQLSPEYELRAVYGGETISFGEYMRNVLLYDYLEPELAWDTVLYTIKPGGSLTLEGDFDMTYGGVPEGEYLLCKKAVLVTEDGERIERVYTAEFAVIED